MFTRREEEQIRADKSFEEQDISSTSRQNFHSSKKNKVCADKIFPSA